MGGIFIFALLVPGGCRAIEGETVPEIVYFNTGEEHRFDTSGEILKVMTLNLAHGRGTRALQEFVSNKKT